MIYQRQLLLAPLVGLLLLSGCNHAVQPPIALMPLMPKTTAPQHPSLCPEPRPEAGQLIACPMNYQPVCALHADGTRSTHANACSACANSDIISYEDAACP